MAKLTAKREKFVQEYLIDLNATQAAIRAGYSPKTAAVIGAEILRIPNVARVIEGKQAEIAAKAHVSQEYVLTSLKEVAARCMVAKPVMEFNQETRRLEQAKDEETGEGIWQFDSKGANQALQLLGKHINMFRDKVELTGKDGGAIQTESQVKFYIPDNKRDS